MGVTITTRVSKEIEKQIKAISRVEQLDKSAVIRRLLTDAIKKWQIEHALKQYKEGKITIGKAAKIAGVSLRQMIDLASERGVPFQYTIKDLQEDYEAAAE